MLNILTSCSENLRPSILSCDMMYIYNYLRVSKQKFAFISSSDNCIYSSSDELCGIHVFKLPFIVNSDLVLFTPKIDPEILNKYNQFFIPKHFPWIILPIYYWEMYCAGDIVCHYTEEGDVQYLDKTTNMPIDWIYTDNMSDYKDLIISDFLQQVYNFRSRKREWEVISIYENMQRNEDIIYGFFDQKTIYGNFIFNWYINCSKSIGLFLYKGIISVNKSDRMDGILYSNKNEKGIYMLELRVYKKKNPISTLYLDPYIESAFICYNNIM